MQNDALRARFDGYDKNGNGSLGLGEFADLLDELGAGYSEAQVKSAFESLDTDQNGEMDFAEFAEWWVGQ